MTDRLDLGGQWRLTLLPEGACSPNHPDELARLDNPAVISAAVPGNLELDLWRAGEIDDPYVGMNAKQLRRYEFYEWWLERDFELAGLPAEGMELVFEGLDCFATVWLNGQQVGVAANAFIAHVFDVTASLRPGGNHLVVRIGSANNEARRYPVDAASLSAYAYNYEALRVRKPAHAWGWDIAPRMALGGIWRPVYLRPVSPARFTENHLQVLPSSNTRNADLLLHYNFETADAALLDYRLKVTGVCEDSRFELDRPVWATGGVFHLNAPQPKLWWPRGYGEANLYQVAIELYRGGRLLAVERRTLGIRTVELKVRPKVTDGGGPDFQFIINGAPVVVKGANWVPADALHSRDSQRIPAMVELAEDLNCNMLRVWGGGVYEPHLFYDLCDRKGIMVWQDFMMGCMAYPQDDDFQRAMGEEAGAIIKMLRRHPSIVLWAGDNECDLVAGWAGLPCDPNRNLLTRRTLPEQVRRHDPTRPYLPSSPWISPQAFAAAKEAGVASADRFSAEQHLWGPRDYFKSDFYRNTNASFVSEIGYHGCPGVGSIERFISPPHRWPWRDNPEWDYHASNPFHGDDDGLNRRTALMANQIHEMFGAVPGTLDEFVIASQICQAEAQKFFIELIRTRKGGMTGILWWNLIDCWPQFSDAIVDYYFNRKLAYYFIRRLQQPVLVMLTEPEVSKRQVVIVNDSLKPVRGHFEIRDADSGEALWGREFSLEADGRLNPASLPAPAGETRMLLISWDLADGARGGNHCLCGAPPFDLEQYRRHWLPRIAGLHQSFDAARIGQ